MSMPIATRPLREVHVVSAADCMRVT